MPARVALCAPAPFQSPCSGAMSPPKPMGCSGLLFPLLQPMSQLWTHHYLCAHPPWMGSEEVWEVKDSMKNESLGDASEDQV